MADDDVMIECLLGPYRGQMLRVPPAARDKAIADRWAREPRTGAHDELPPEYTTEELGDAIRAATDAAAVLRGEVAPAPPDPPERDKPAPGGDYETRSVPKRK